MISTSKVLEEWNLLQFEEFLVLETQGIVELWQEIFLLKDNFGEAKYPNLTIVVKRILSSSHGSGDV